MQVNNTKTTAPLFHPKMLTETLSLNKNRAKKQKEIAGQIVGTGNSAAAFDWHEISTKTNSLLHGVSWNVNSLNFTFKADQSIKEFRVGGGVLLKFYSNLLTVIPLSLLPLNVLGAVKEQQSIMKWICAVELLAETWVFSGPINP